MPLPPHNSQPELTSLTGRVFGGRYRVEEAIGRGGMSVVYRAIHLQTEATVALKIMTGALGSDEKKRLRFEQEAHASARLDHPSIIRVLDYGRSEDDLLFIAMELLTGCTLGQWLKAKGPLSLSDACHLMQQTCNALEVAHDLGVIHRDLKPDNIFLINADDDDNPFSSIKLLDFGIAKVAGQTDVETLTETGFICGTPLYISPEQALGMPLDGRSDLYAVGVLLFQLITGRTPFHADTPIALVMKHIHNAPPSFESVNPSASVPAQLDDLIQSLLAKNREQRPASARMVGDLLSGMAEVYADIPAAVSSDLPVVTSSHLPKEAPRGLYVDSMQLGTGAVDQTRDDLPEFADSPATTALAVEEIERMRAITASQMALGTEANATQALEAEKIERMRNISSLHRQIGTDSKVSGGLPNGVEGQSQRLGWFAGALFTAVVAAFSVVFWMSEGAQPPSPLTMTPQVQPAVSIPAAAAAGPGSVLDTGRIEPVSKRTAAIKHVRRIRQRLELRAQPAAPPTAAVPNRRAIQILSVPTKASVIVRGTVVGNTPYKFDVEGSTPETTLIVSRKGYLPQSWRYDPQFGLAPEQKQVTLVLERDSRARKKRKRARKKIRWEE